jgi:hypothetical protein
MASEQLEAGLAAAAVAEHAPGSAAARALRWAGAACLVLGVAAWALQPVLLPVALPWAERIFSADHAVSEHGRLLLRLALAGLGAGAAALGMVLWIHGRRGDAGGLARLFADEPRQPAGPTYRTLALACAATAGCLAAFLAWRGRPWFAGEDRALEDAQLLAGAVAAALFARAAARLPRRSGPRRSQAALALGCGLLVLEEVSWGQRLFGWRTAATWASLNEQGETNLHNLLAHSAAVQLAGVGVVALVALAGMLLRSRRRSPGLAAWLLPPPSLLPFPAAIVAIQVFHLRGIHGTGWDELQELLGAVLLAAFAAVSHTRAGSCRCSGQADLAHSPAS